MNKKKTEIIKAKFKIKSLIMLETKMSKEFHGYHIIIKDKSIMVMLKNQVDIKDNIIK